MPSHYKRAPRRRRNGGRASTAQKALAVAQSVKRMVNVEYKQTVTAFEVDPNSTGSVGSLMFIAQGLDTDDRIGDKIRVKRLALSGTVTLHASATNSRVRFVIVRDNNGSTTVPGITDLFTSADAMQKNVPKLGTPQSNSRFTVLWDKLVIVNTDTPTKQVNFALTLDHHCYWNGPATTDEGKGHIYIMNASNEATNDPVVAITSHIWYLDN